MTKKVSKAMVPGSHGSTFAGNPLAMSVGNAVMDQIFKKGFLSNVRKISSIRQLLSCLGEKYLIYVLMDYVTSYGKQTHQSITRGSCFELVRFIQVTFFYKRWL